MAYSIWRELNQLWPCWGENSTWSFEFKQYSYQNSKHLMTSSISSWSLFDGHKWSSKKIKDIWERLGKYQLISRSLVCRDVTKVKQHSYRILSMRCNFIKLLYKPQNDMPQDTLKTVKVSQTPWAWNDHWVTKPYLTPTVSKHSANLTPVPVA